MADQEIQEFDPKNQQMLNTPLTDPTGLDDEHKQFLEMLVGLVNEGKIDLFKPETLLNMEVYQQQSEEEKGKIDLESVNLLGAIREIKGLYDAGYKETFQMQNLVSRLKHTKERLENQGGDLFII